MKKWSLIIDVGKCHDCNNCFLACKDEFVGNDWPPYSVGQPWHGQRWMNIMRKERGQYPLVDVAYRPTPCMHCDSPRCVEAAGNGAIYKRDDGIVIVDPHKARRQKALLEACPYGAMWWNDEKETPQKCTLCAHLLDDGWQTPRCVQACPTGALRAVSADDAEMAEIRKTEGLEVLCPELNTSPRVHYKNLYRFEKCFIAGSVALADRDECADGAEVTLTSVATGAATVTSSNNYGDFKFDNLSDSSGDYGIRVEYAGYPAKELRVELKEASINAGVIFLEKETGAG
jgi:Fe-S-cluster-containing dehydrogenase component